MEAHIIDWDGRHIPEALSKMPPGRYFFESVDVVPTLTREQEDGILGALDDLDAGHEVSLDDVVRSLRDNPTHE